MIASMPKAEMEEFFLMKIPLNIMITPKTADITIEFIANWFSF
jgi:hypothetical protein